MAGKTPIPKSQREIANSQITPYDTSRGNPNNTSIDKRENNQNVNPDRANQISKKGDTWKPLTIGIKDIDETIKYYFDYVIRPSVIQNDQRIAVPVVYGSPERWKSMQRDGYYRDKKGKIMAPLIMFKRNSIDRVRGLTNKIDANYPQSYALAKQKYTAKNAYNNISVLNGYQPITTYQTVIIPDYVNLNYNCIIYTYYVEQLNHVIESINFAADTYWGDPERFKFKAVINSYQTITELNAGQERMVKGTFDIKMHGYIIPSTIQSELNSMKKVSTANKVVFNTETIETLTNNRENRFIENIDTNL
jgi:hypothetical protein